ncbi:MAG: DUF3619 family protein [Betaproteobacteria bacterium]|nr:DUF3619 family protein [Betaproteobacteria bacterium]MBI2960233.1 DUF3619 family protein [Betaproteobacteria bacterium]
MNEQQLAYRIRQCLNQGTELDGDTIERLKAAREAALARQRMAAARPAFAWADNVTGRFAGPGSLVSRLLLPMAVIILGLLAINVWHQAQVAQEIEEIDTAVLKGDLPLDAYLDKGFDAWLRRSSH